MIISSARHTIEHIAYVDGLNMLKECNRVLKSGGKIRVSTSNLEFLIDLYSRDKSKLQETYIQWACNKFIKNDICSDTMVINNFVRDWRHVFIYDEKTPRGALDVSGFVDVRPYCINESDDSALSNLENEKRMPAGFLKLESLILGGKKP